MDSSCSLANLIKHSFLHFQSLLTEKARKQLKKQLFGEHTSIEPTKMTSNKQLSLLEEDLQLSSDSDESINLSDEDDQNKQSTSEATSMDLAQPSDQSIQDVILQVQQYRDS